MLIYAAVDADLYVSPIWEESLIDADAIFDSFSTYCHQATSKCALYRSGDDAKDIENRFLGVLNRIKKQPVVIISPFVTVPLVVTHSDIKSLLFSTLYGPTQVFPAVATIVDYLHRGFDDILGQFIIPPAVIPLGIYCEQTLPSWLYPTDALNAIMCSDKRYPVRNPIHGSSLSRILLTLCSSMKQFQISRSYTRRWRIYHLGLTFG